MNKLTSAIYALALLMFGASSSHAQQRELTLKELVNSRADFLTVPISYPSGWADDDHYLQSVKGSAPQQVNVKTGVASPYKRTYTNAPQTRRSEKLENELSSPDGAWVAYTQNNNLYAKEIASGRIVQYTTDGSDNILNGVASWVYYEEILDHATRTFWWSPDSKQLVFYRSDQSKVPTFPVFNINGQHGSLKTTYYPKAGDPNPQVTIGIVGVEGGAITWADFNAAEDQYFGSTFWAPDGKSIWIQWMPRRQNLLKIYAVDLASGKKNEVYTETQATWINWKEEITFLKKQQGYLIQNTTDGWNQVYLYNMNGTLKNQITKGKNFWKTKIVHVDEAKQILYFTSNGEKSTRIDLYSVKFDGSSLKRLTFGDYTHEVFLSPSAKYYITRYSNLQTPIRIALVDCKTGKIMRELADSKSPEFDNILQGKSEVIEYTTADGYKVPAMIFWPIRLDENKKYPVHIQTYGGPNRGLVQDRWWGGGLSLYAHMGAIRVILDHRGSGHCGQKGVDCMYRNLGKYEIADFIDFVKEFLYSKPYIDRTKIGIEGHSYGGYLTALALTKGSEYFKYGIASSGVMDWQLYDSHYTERYMDTPANNPEGYKESSVLNYIDNYKADNHLFIRHGLVDDNVHPQNSFQLIQALQQKQKPFQMVIYPECAHGYISRSLNATSNDATRFWFQSLFGQEAPEEVLR